MSNDAFTDLPRRLIPMAKPARIPGPLARAPRSILLTGLLAGLLGAPTAVLAQPPGQQPPPEVTGGESVGADRGGNESAKKLFTVRSVPQADQPPQWAGEAQIGLGATTGNSENSNLNANALISYTAFPWRHFLGAEAIIAETNGERTTERYAVGYKPEYFFSRRTFAFGFFGYDRDPFSNIDNRYSATLGLGHVLLWGDRQTLTVELGGGYRITQFTEATPDSEEPVGRAGFDYTLKLTDNTQFTQDFSVLAGSDNTFIESITALRVAMTDKLALSLSYTVLNNSFTPPGIESTDTFTSVNLVAAF
jgi:putative salt-induced outer membrane protein